MSSLHASYASNICSMHPCIHVATTIAAVTSGVGLLAPAPVLTFGSFTPPVCSSASHLKAGFVQFKIKALPPILIEPKKVVLEGLFRDIYNEMYVLYQLYVSMYWIAREAHAIRIIHCFECPISCYSNVLYAQPIDVYASM
jgi:hypothetical protein